MNVKMKKKVTKRTANLMLTCVLIVVHSSYFQHSTMTARSKTTLLYMHKALKLCLSPLMELLDASFDQQFETYDSLATQSVEG